MPESREGQEEAQASRNRDGTFVKGGPSPCPGGLPKWVRKAREAMREELYPLAQRHLTRVLSGQRPKDSTQEEDKLYGGVTVEDRTTAAKLVLEYSIPKPKQAVGVEHRGAGGGGVSISIDLGAK